MFWLVAGNADALQRGFDVMGATTTSRTAVY
jgi:hypothetical protein